MNTTLELLESTDTVVADLTADDLFEIWTNSWRVGAGLPLLFRMLAPLPASCKHCGVLNPNISGRTTPSYACGNCDMRDMRDMRGDIRGAVDFYESIKNVAQMHLEIGNVIEIPSVETAGRFVKSVKWISVCPPAVFERPANKCPHGVWCSTSCYLCNPVRLCSAHFRSIQHSQKDVQVPADLFVLLAEANDWCESCVNQVKPTPKNFKDKMDLPADNFCNICGVKVEGWRQNYCQPCARQTLMEEVEIYETEQPNVEGLHAAYQEVKARPLSNKTAVTFEEVRAFARDKVWFVFPDLEFNDDDLERWLAVEIKWYGDLLRRFYLRIKGATLQQIAEWEDVKKQSISTYFSRQEHEMKQMNSATNSLGSKY